MNKFTPTNPFKHLFTTNSRSISQSHNHRKWESVLDQLSTLQKVKKTLQAQSQQRKIQIEKSEESIMNLGEALGKVRKQLGEERETVREYVDRAEKGEEMERAAREEAMTLQEQVDILAQQIVDFETMKRQLGQLCVLCGQDFIHFIFTFIIRKSPPI